MNSLESTFGLKQVVVLENSEHGTVVGIYHHAEVPTHYMVRYWAGGERKEQWFQESELTAA
jgi:hypothetical protein